MYLKDYNAIGTGCFSKIKVSGSDSAGNQLSAKKLKDMLAIHRKWDFVDCEVQPDLVIFHSAHSFYKEACQGIIQQRMNHGFSSFLLVVTGESTDFFYTGVDYSISHKLNAKNNYYKPFCVAGVELQQLLDNKIPGSVLQARKTPKTAFCNFIYSNEANYKRFPGVAERRDFCKLLSQYKRVDCAGVSLNNTDKLRVIEENFNDYCPAKLQFMRDYKFTIAFENRSVEGYITEKIWHAYLTGTIPIYWGSPNIAKFFNPESFVNCHDYGSFAEVIDRVKEIDNDMELFERYINAAPILEDSELYGFTKDKISMRMDAIMEEVVKKRIEIRQLKYPRLYELFRWLEFIFANRFFIKKRIIVHIKSMICKA